MRDRISAAVTAIAHLAARRSEAKRAGNFQQRADDLRRPAAQLAAHCETLGLLRKHGVAVPLKVELPRSLCGQALDLQSRFVTDAESILAADPKRSAAFWKPLEGYPDQVAGELKQAWSAWVSAALPGGETELLTVLDKFESFREPVQVIRGGVAEARRLSSDLPMSDLSFTEVLRIAGTIGKAWEQLNGAHVSAEVLTFLKKAAVREASLADYTPDVMKWVQENGLLQAFQIILGGK